MTNRLAWLYALHWQQPLPTSVPGVATLLKGVLKLAAWGYGIGVTLRTIGYDLGILPQTRVAVPVISIGNLTTGGTGKTPALTLLAHAITQAGHRVVVLTQGYGAPEPLSYGQPQGPQHGDEAWQLQCAVPQAVVIVGRDRLANAQRAITDYQPDVILLDDGFQHRRLARDVDVVLVDGERGFGNGQLLPLGPLREPLSNIKRATQVVVTKATPTPSRLHALATFGVPIQYAPFGPLTHGTETPFSHGDTQHPVALATLNNAPLMACSAIAHPASFFEALAGVGLTVPTHLAFPDHHTYTHEDVAPWVDHFEAGGWLLTTPKDWAKLQQLLPTPWQSQCAILSWGPSDPSVFLPKPFQWLLQPKQDKAQR